MNLSQAHEKKKKKWEYPNKTKIRGEIKANTTDIEKIIRELCSYLPTNWTAWKMNKFLESYNLPKLNQKETIWTEKSLVMNAFVIKEKELPENESPEPGSFTG